MIRRSLAFASALSLILCAAVIVLWVRGQVVLEDVEYERMSADVEGWHSYVRDGIFVRDGAANYAHSVILRNPIFHDSWPVGLKHHHDSGVNTAYYDCIIKPQNSMAGFASGSVHGHNGTMDFKGRGVRVPLWPVLVVGALLPLRWLVLKRRASTRRRRGLCLSCGYDVRGINDCCPECGKPTTPNAESAPA